MSGVPGVLPPLPADDLGGQWFPAAGLAQTSRRLPRALLSAPVVPLLVIAPAFVTESHAVLVAALLGRHVPGLITAVVITCRSEFLPCNLHYGNNGFVLTRPGKLIGVAIALHLIWHSSVYWRAR